MGRESNEAPKGQSPLYTPKDVAKLKKADTHRAADGAYRFGDNTRMPSKVSETEEREAA